MAALFSSSGIAGVLLFAGVAAIALSFWLRSTPALVAGLAPLVAGLVLVFIGFMAEAGGGGMGVLEAIVETFNSVIRLGANSISFARLAAFGMVHASIGSLVWTGSQALFVAGLWFAAVPLFLVGNVVGFTLELVVAGIQALRLEYYELFSRIYSGEGRAFKPWHLTVIKEAL